MNPDDAKIKIKELLLRGQSEEALGFVRKTFGIEEADAILLMETVKDELLEQGHSLPEKREAIEKTEMVKDLDITPEQVRQFQKQIVTSFLFSSSILRGCFTYLLIMGAAIFGLFSIGSLAGLGIYYYFQKDIIENGIKVEGEVLEMRSDPDDERAFAPTIRYHLDGIERRYLNKYYHNPPEFQVGQKVILYLQNPEADQIILESSGEVEFFMKVLGGICLFFITITFILILVSRKLGKTNPPQPNRNG